MKLAYFISAIGLLVLACTQAEPVNCLGLMLASGVCQTIFFILQSKDEIIEAIHKENEHYGTEREI